MCAYQSLHSFVHVHLRHSVVPGARSVMFEQANLLRGTGAGQERLHIDPGYLCDPPPTLCRAPRWCRVVSVFWSFAQLSESSMDVMDMRRLSRPP